MANYLQKSYLVNRDFFQGLSDDFQWFYWVPMKMIPWDSRSKSSTVNKILPNLQSHHSSRTVSPPPLIGNGNARSYCLSWVLSVGLEKSASCQCKFPRLPPENVECRRWLKNIVFHCSAYSIYYCASSFSFSTYEWNSILYYITDRMLNISLNYCNQTPTSD